MIKKCKKHGTTDHATRKRGGTRCRKCAVESVTKRRHKLKQMAINHLGGKCVICDYNKCPNALAFHHKSPHKKEFQISHGNNKSWERIKLELKKCVLVCQNCHHEIHAGITCI